ncbi:hypothetical protein NE237_010599 [Protea cynaroides]|uniref:Uncharacterized protein n=1 Tax=Protea cynaroides TaxID=273540 RepID=A0A9Q0L012_9MAGN|nr:hypothetical protein NE237_010599 [Protea cynaroides]
MSSESIPLDGSEYALGHLSLLIGFEYVFRNLSLLTRSEYAFENLSLLIGSEYAFGNLSLLTGLMVRDVSRSGFDKWVDKLWVWLSVLILGSSVWFQIGGDLWTGGPKVGVNKDMVSRLHSVVLRCCHEGWLGGCKVLRQEGEPDDWVWCSVTAVIMAAWWDVKDEQEIIGIAGL